MMPPICFVCDEPVGDGDGGGLVQFARRDEDRRWDERMEATGGVGHPPYLRWFCAKHRPAARKLAHETVDVAMRKLRELND